MRIKLLLAYILLCLVGVLGVLPLPTRETALGYYKINANRYGVAIYQDGLHASVQFEGASSYRVSGSTATLQFTPSHILALTYSRDDIIFDKDGTLYTEPTQEQIAYLSKQLNLSLVKAQHIERRMPMAYNTVYLVNPNIPGMLVIHPTKESNLFIDRDKKQIDSSELISSITVETRETLVL